MKIRKSAVFVLLVIIISIFMTTRHLVRVYKYKQTYEYKFLQLDYSIEEIKVLEENLKKDQLDELLLKEYNEHLSKLVNKKYFIYNNLDRYNKYLDESKKEVEEVITLVNVNRDRNFYENINKTNIDDGILMLVNKYYTLDKDYEPKDIVVTNSSHSYANNSLNSEAYNAFISLHNDALKEGHTILINSSFRTYEHQEKLWKEREQFQGIEKADEYAARAGHSEHQTGYTIDVADFNNPSAKFETTDAFKWMSTNSYKYGFILRYPEDMENITGYNYEPWHYRYIGVDTATKVFKEKITYDEYYAYYIENK